MSQAAFFATEASWEYRCQHQQEVALSCPWRVLKNVKICCVQLSQVRLSMFSRSLFTKRMVHQYQPFPHWGRCIWQYGFPFTFRTTSRHIAEALGSGNYFVCLMASNVPKWVSSNLPTSVRCNQNCRKGKRLGASIHTESEASWGPCYTSLIVSTLTWCDHCWKRSCEMYFFPILHYIWYMFKKTNILQHSATDREFLFCNILHMLVHRPRLQSLGRSNSGDSMPGISANGQACSKTFCV